jgi:hypothetical protein
VGGGRATDPRTLGASADLAERLQAWQRRWEQDGRHWEEGSAASADGERWGRRLSRRLQRELGPNVDVRYRG